jgi:hypothetical protein
MRAERALGVKLGAPRRSLFDNLDRLNPGAGEREQLFNAHSVAFAANGEGAGNIVAAVVDGKNLALEILNTILIAFLDLDGNTNDIASAELGIILVRESLGLFGVNLINKLNTHDSPPAA